MALLASALFAGIRPRSCNATSSPQFVHEIGGSANVVVGSIQAIWKTMANGFSDELRHRRHRPAAVAGRHGQHAPTIWLIIGAVTFGALLEELGLIDRPICR